MALNQSAGSTGEGVWISRNRKVFSVWGQKMWLNCFLGVPLKNKATELFQKILHVSPHPFQMLSLGSFTRRLREINPGGFRQHSVRVARLFPGQKTEEESGLQSKACQRVCTRGSRCQRRETKVPGRLSHPTYRQRAHETKFSFLENFVSGWNSWTGYLGGSTAPPPSHTPFLTAPQISPCDWRPRRLLVASISDPAFNYR